jgi:predicted dienelactone hydrolase
MRRTASLAVIVSALFALARVAQAEDQYNPDASKTDFATFEDNWHDAARDRDVPVKVYYPVPAKGKLPVIIFSHGLGGSREGYSYVGKYWAAHGYVSVHLTHAGSDTEALIANGLTDLQGQAQAIATNPKNAVDRCKDVSFAIDHLSAVDKEDSSPLKDHLDLTRIGMSGHSFGANTTMLIAGELTRTGKTFADSRIKCAIAMSPPIATPESAWDKVYAKVKIPLFVMTGTLDDSPVGETTADQRRVPFDHVANIPAFLITLEGADHMVFSGHRRGPEKPTDNHQYQLIEQGTLAFWDAYLTGNEAAKKWFTGDGYKTLVGDAGKFEQRDAIETKK